ncbi:hypothetical protein ABZ621_36555 [Streptomyces sp. NPDC007863]|uniref:hypothetical protein n=1 Tax=Streptomyces sp. NPDC007863 TaxID=3154894 RepID=UPI0033EF1858
MARTWSAVLARLGVPTGDGRIIDPAGGSSRDLPLPLMWQELSDDGHGGSRVVGRIETLRIADGMVTATGSLLEDIPYSVTEQLEAGVVGPSVDLDDIEYVMDEAERLIITRWRIAGATLVSIPAFADVSLTLDPLPAEPVGEPEESPMDAMWASAAPEELPPAGWFQRPDVDRLTPLTVTDTGRVFGHIAGWDTCHVGLPGCVTPPSSPTGYTYFHVAEQRTQDGATLPVGTLVAGPRHADAQLAFRAAQEHYDDPAAAVARVVAGEDEHGIWVAGWLLPGASAEALDVFRSSPVSGDWRRVGGALELIGVCSVNTPGFPVPRARVHFAAGHQRALIGSFGITPRSGGLANLADVNRQLLQDCRENGETVDQARARWAWAAATTED